jgi:hypothetical protein
LLMLTGSPCSTQAKTLLKSCRSFRKVAVFMFNKYV